AELARAAFALHDAQSAIAREYGFASWAELRDKVAALTQTAPPPPDAETLARFAASHKLGPDMVAKLREALTAREARTSPATPAIAPILPLRNAVVFPGAVLPIDVMRPTTLRAIDAAAASEPRLIAIFAQRAADTERPAQDELHSPGCLCELLLVH